MIRRPPLTIADALGFLNQQSGDHLTPIKGIGDVTSSAPGSAARYNTGKAPLDLIPLRCMVDYYRGVSALMPAHQLDALSSLTALASWQEWGKQAALEDALASLGDCWTECAQVFAYGKQKYAAWNWAKGFEWSVPLACAARHLRAILDGEEIDRESTLPHRGHVFCNVVMLMTFMRTYPEGDDRPRLLAPVQLTQG